MIGLLLAILATSVTVEIDGVRCVTAAPVVYDHGRRTIVVTGCIRPLFADGFENRAPDPGCGHPICP